MSTGCTIGRYKYTKPNRLYGIKSSHVLDDTIKSYDIMLHQSLDQKHRGDIWEFMLILENEPIVSKCFSKNELKKLSLLWISVLAGYHKSAELLVRSGADVTECFGCHDPQAIDQNWTILHLLLQMDPSPEIQDLICLVSDHDADLQAKDDDGLTPLHYAVMKNRVEMIEMLLEKGADVNVANKHGMTPLFLAASIRDLTVENFLDHGIDLNVQCNYQALLCCVTFQCNFKRIGCKQVVETLLKRGADVHQRTSLDHSTALHGVCQRTAFFKSNELLVAEYVAEMYKGIIELLLSAGADVLAEDRNGKTPLAHISAYCNEDNMESVRDIPLGTWEIIKAMALIKVRRAIIELKDERIIEQFPVLRSYYQRCIEEIERMRSVRFIVTCSLFDLLTKSEYQIATLMTNPEFKPKFSLCSLGGFDEFPIYAGSFLKAFKRAERYFESMIEQEDIVNEAVYYTLPFLVVRNVVRHILNDRDYSSKRM